VFEQYSSVPPAAARASSPHQIAEHEAARRAEAALKQEEAAAAAATRRVLSAERSAAKAQRRANAAQQLEAQQVELADWRRRKLLERNAPMQAADAWVHRAALEGRDKSLPCASDGAVVAMTKACARPTTHTS
jgi:hypothetical protein